MATPIPTWDETTEITPTWDETSPIEETPRVAQRTLEGYQPIQFSTPAEPIAQPSEQPPIPTLAEELPTATKMLWKESGKSPIPTPFPDISPDENPWTAAAKEAINLLVGIPQFATSGRGLATAPIAAARPALTAAAFTGDMLYNLGKQIYSTIPNWNKLTTAQQAVAVTDMVGTGALAAILGKSAAKGLKQKGVQNASEITSPKVVPELEVRPPVGEETPLRQLGKTPGAQAGPNGLPQGQVAADNPIIQQKAAEHGLDPDKLAKQTNQEIKDHPTGIKGDVETAAQIAADTDRLGENDLKGPKTPQIKPQEAEKAIAKPDPNWRVTVSQPQVPGDLGYVQIDDVSGGVNKWSTSPEKLRARGLDIPDFSKLPQGQYTFEQAQKLLAAKPTPEVPLSGAKPLTQKQRAIKYYRDLAKEEFPSMPDATADSLSQFLSETKGVMQSEELSPNEAMQRAVRAYIRHNKTNYESQFGEGFDRSENRAAIGGQIDKIYNQWRAGYKAPELEQTQPSKPILSEQTLEEIKTLKSRLSELDKQRVESNRATKKRKEQGLVGETDEMKTARYSRIEEETKIRSRITELSNPTPTPAKEPTPVESNEPWQEFLDNVIAGKYQKDFAVEELMKREAVGKSDAIKHFEALTHPKRGKEPWMLTKKEYADSEFYPKTPYNRGGYNKMVAELDHESFVQEAISEGKPVPPEVLADYPDLAKAKEPVASVTGKPAPIKEVKVPKDIAATKQDVGIGGNEGAIYGLRYESTDFGSERAVIVTDSFGKEIGRKDPFWPKGVPTSEKARKLAIAKAGRQIVDEYESKQSPTQPPTVQSEKGPEPIGMGGAVPTEFQPIPQSPTAMKYKLIDQERQQRGLEPLTKPESVPDQVAMDKAMAALDQDPAFADKLIDEINSGRKSVIEDWENHVLLLRKIDIRNEYAKSAREAAQAYEDGRMEDLDAANARTQAWGDALTDVEKASRQSGSARGRALRSLQVMANEDFSLASLEMQKRAARGGKPITASERADLERIANEYKSKSDSLEKLIAQKSSEAAEKAVKEALDKIAKEAKSAVQYHPKVLEAAERIVVGLEKRAESASQRLRERLARMNVGADPTIVLDLAEVGAAKLARASLDLAKWSDLMIREYGPKIEPFLKQGYEAAKRLLEKDLSKVKAPIKKVVSERATKPEKQSETLEGLRGKIETRLIKGKDISAFVQKVARVFVENGIKEREPLIDKVHEFLSGIIPDITRRDTMDAISGYGDFKQLSKDQITVELRGMKGEMQQLAKLEDMAKGQPPLKSGVERRTPTEAERQLIKKVNEAKFAFQVPMTDPATQLKSALDTYKTNLKNRIADYQDRLNRGDYSRKPRRELQLDKDALTLRHQMEVVKRKFHEELIKDKLANQDAWQRAGRFSGEIVNTMRALKASVDLSATLRQGGLIVATHPIRGAKVMPDQLKALVSPKEQYRVEQEILARPNYRLYERSGLNLTEHGQKLSQMEEAYMSRWAEHIPGVAASQRAYTVFLNKLRADSFDAMAKWVTNDGKTELGIDEGKIIANYINVATGRGNIGLKENALVGLNTAFFAPRLVASRFQYLFGQPIYHGLFSGKTNLAGTLRARTLVASEYARFLIAVGTIYSLAHLAGFSVELDPRSSDFGKIKVGKTRIDLMAGLIQGTVLLSRLASGKQKTMRGKVIPIRGSKAPYGSSNSADIIARFLRTKLSPAFGTSVDILTGKDVVGQTVTPKSIATGAVVPLSLNDIYSAIKEQGVPAGSALGMMAILGVGVQTYNTQKPVKQFEIPP